jgi:hypothetical protein
MVGASEAPADVTLAYSDFDAGTVDSSGPGSYSHPGSIDANPRFADSSFRLQPGSPAIDAGDPAGLAAAIPADAPNFNPGFPAEAARDRDGRARVVDGNRDGAARTDLGAFEAPTPAPPVQRGTTPSSPLVRIAISRFRITNRVFAVAKRATALAARKRQVKRGTVFSYTLPRPAAVTITIAKKGKGFRKGRKCVARRPKGKRHAKRCTLYRTKGRLKRAGVAGSNRVPFSGRIGRRALKPGTYRATIAAKDAAGKSPARRISFRIVKG